jgi:hypothetical protein
MASLLYVYYQADHINEKVMFSTRKCHASFGKIGAYNIKKRRGRKRERPNIDVVILLATFHYSLNFRSYKIQIKPFKIWLLEHYSIEKLWVQVTTKKGCFLT